VFQEPHLFPHLTVSGNIAFGMEIQKFPKKEISERVAYLLDLMQMKELGDRYPNQLSGGQKQRVSIARALAPGPSLLLMDEPFSGLDQELREEMGTMMKELQQKMKLTIIFVTHHRDECLRLSDSIALLKDGSILQQGTVNQVYYQPINQEAAKLMGKGNWIQGQFQNETFYCDFFEKKVPNALDGKGEILIRPHQIKILALKNSVNSLDKSFKVTNIQKMGKEFQIHVKRKDVCLIIETFDRGGIQVGDYVLVEFN
jgi:ABC-type sulfate/molybdate transport systems ATPase subunit